MERSSLKIFSPTHLVIIEVHIAAVDREEGVCKRTAPAVKLIFVPVPASLEPELYVNLYDWVLRFVL